uniref:MazG-like nucleotide pyrophosphohydrolase n=1 Tax=Micrococcus phage Kurnik TaxID=3092208 RepID=A0AAU6R676_9CAUD
MSNRTNFEDIGDFHRKFETPASDGIFIGSEPGPTDLTPELVMFRCNFLLEELSEYFAALGVHFSFEINFDDYTPEAVDHLEAFDALIDLAVIVFGTAHVSGYPWEQGWREVHKKNMEKVRAAKDGSDSKRGSAFDIVKPAGWTAPDHGPALRAAGFDV